MIFSCIVADGLECSWGDFQSILQLSIALNTAFIAFNGYFGDIVESKKDKIKFFVNKRANDAEIKIDGLTSRQQLMSLSGELVKIEMNYRDFISGPFRMISMAFIIPAMILLIVSSYDDKCKISLFWQTISLAHLIPFALGLLVYAATISRLFVTFRIGMLTFHIQMRLASR